MDLADLTRFDRAGLTRRMSIIGAKFGRLVVIDDAMPTIRKDRGTKQRTALVKCECGNEKVVQVSCLRSGNTTSCGCFAREVTRLANSTHGEAGSSRSTEYHSWRGMIDRCTNQQHISHKYYGPFGVKICRKWRNSFEAFLADMGRKPSPRHSIDRFPDPNGNYEPGNCRWATPQEQGQNFRTTKRIEFNGELLTSQEWSLKTKISNKEINRRLGRGWSVERTLTQSMRTRCRP